MPSAVNKKRMSLEEAKKQIDKIFSQAMSDLRQLHQAKMDLIAKYEEADRKKEIEKIRQDLKNLITKH